MEIAAWWHGPMNPGLTAFSSTGTITEDLLPEIERELRGTVGINTRDLQALAAYVRRVTGEPAPCPECGSYRSHRPLPSGAMCPLM